MTIDLIKSKNCDNSIELQYEYDNASNKLVKHSLEKLRNIHIYLTDKLCMPYEPIITYDSDNVLKIYNSIIEREKKLKYTNEKIILKIYEFKLIIDEEIEPYLNI